jgi:hypothetical protein
MAGGRDLTKRSPRWLNGLIWSSGIAAALCFIWRVLVDDSDVHGVALSFTNLLCRLLAAAVLPALLLLATLGRAARRLMEGV